MRENGGHIRLKNNLHKTCKELAELLGATVISSASVGKLRTKMSSRNPSGDPRMICIASDGICSSLRKSVAYLHSVPLVHFSFLFHCAFAFQRLPVDNYVIRNPILPLSWEKEPIEPAQLPPELAAVEGPQVDREFPFEAEDGHLPRVEIVGSKAFHDRWTRALQESGVFLTRRLGSAHEQFHVRPRGSNISIHCVIYECIVCLDGWCGVAEGAACLGHPQARISRCQLQMGSPIARCATSCVPHTGFMPTSYLIYLTHIACCRIWPSLEYCRPWGP